MKQKNAFMYVLFAFLVGAVAVGGFATGWTFNFSTTGGLGDDAVTQPTSCDIQPYIDLTAKDELTGDIFSVSSDYKLNGDYLGTLTTGSSGDTFSVGDEVELLIKNSSNIDKIIPVYTINECGSNKIIVEQKVAVTSPSVTLKDDSNDDLTDSATGGTNNLSAIVDGGQENFVLEIDGSNEKTTGDLIYVVELGNKLNVTDISASVLSGGITVEKLGSVPDIYTETLSNPEVVAFRISEIEGASTGRVNFIIESGDGSTSGTAVYTTAYIEQAFVDSDRVRTFTVGVENQDNVDKSLATWDYDFYVN